MNVQEWLLGIFQGGKVKRLPKALGHKVATSEVSSWFPRSANLVLFSKFPKDNTPYCLNVRVECRQFKTTVHFENDL